MFNSQLDSWIFFGAHIFSFWALATAIVLLKHGREGLRENEHIRLILETGPSQGNPSDGSGDKSRWDQFKEWCGRNKGYIGLGILATIAVLSAIVLYYEYKEILVPPLPPETKLNSGLGKPSSLSQTRDGLLAKDFFFPELTNPRKVGGKDFFDKERLVLSRIFEMLDFYKHDTPSDPRVIGALQAMKQFLQSDVERWNIGHLLHFNLQPHESYAVIGYHNRFMGDWEDASPQLKTLFNFLTQSSAPGPHRQAQEAFDVLRTDFIAKVNSILGDV